MKKFLLSMCCALGALAMNAETATILDGASATWTGDVNSYTTTVDGFKITLDKASSTTDLVQPEAHIRVYVGSVFTIQAPAGAKMTKVTMTEIHSKATALTDMSWSEGWTAFGSLTSSTKAEEFGATSAGLNTLEISDVKKQVRISKIVVEYTPGTGVVKDDAGMSFPEATYTVTLGDEFAAPRLTKMTDGAVTYTSSVPEVATVDATSGAVTIVAAGTTVITASAPETDDFYAGTAKYTLVVEEPAPDNLIASLLGEDDANTANEMPTGWTVSGTIPEGLTYVWAWKVYNKKGYLNGSAYKNGALEADVLAVSPVIDLTGKKNVTMSFDHAAKFQTTLKTLCGVQVREQGATEWTALEIPTWPEAGAWTFANSGSISLEAFAGKKIEIAFKYGSSATGADTWEIKNLQVLGDDKLAVETIVADENAPVKYYNLQGVEVANPQNGLFIRVQGKKATKVLVK